MVDRKYPIGTMVVIREDFDKAIDDANWYVVKDFFLFNSDAKLYSVCNGDDITMVREADMFPIDSCGFNHCDYCHRKCPEYFDKPKND